jgi:histidinol-phosphatase (PHP family)
MLQALKPAIVGHFDVIRIFRPRHPLSPELWAKVDRNIDYAVSIGALFEINSRCVCVQL